MKKYMLAFLIIIPIMFLAWNMSDFAEESKITYNGTVEEDESYQTDILHEADEKEIIISEESEVMDEESDIISSGWYKYFLEQQEYISNISNGQCSYEIIGEDECEITLYNKEHAKVYSEVCPLHHSWVETISDNILEIGISVGSPARYTFYFDTETAEISDTYFNAKVFGDQYIAYMDSDVIGADEITLTLTDIFEKGILHQEVVRNFSVCADPMSAVHSVEMVDDNSIRLEYCEGEDYTTVSEIIELEWTPMFDDEQIADIKDITWETVDYNVVDLHFHLEDGSTVDREIIGYSVLDIVYEDITGDDADEVLIYCDFVNNTCDWQLVYFYQIDRGNVTDISPSSKDIPELKSNEGYWNTWIAVETMEGYSSHIYTLESYYKENGIMYVEETLYIGYKNGKWELVQGFDESTAADFFYYKW